MEIRPHRRIVLPLNVDTFFDAIELASDMHEHVGSLKVGWELFVSSGPSIFSLGDELGLDIILDVDIDIDLDDSHFIVETVKDDCGIQFIVRYGSSVAMKAIIDNLSDCKTSILVNLTAIANGVELAASTAYTAGFRAFLCRAQDVKTVRDKLGSDISITAINVSPSWHESNDPTLLTPKEVMEAGANFVVVGDPITMAKDRANAARTIAEEIRPFT